MVGETRVSRCLKFEHVSSWRPTCIEGIQRWAQTILTTQPKLVSKVSDLKMWYLSNSWTRLGKSTWARRNVCNSSKQQTQEWPNVLNIHQLELTAHSGTMANLFYVNGIASNIVIPCDYKKTCNQVATIIYKS